MAMINHKVSNILGNIKHLLWLKTYKNKFLYHSTPLAPPSAIAIEITSKCNLHCIMCPLHSLVLDNKEEKRSIGHMDYTLFEHIIEQLLYLTPVPTIGFGPAGEFFLYPKVEGVLSLLKSKNISNKTSIYTNAVYLNKKNTDLLLESFDGSLYISIDGYKETFERIRVGANYDTVINNVMYIIERKKSLNLKMPYIFVNAAKVGQTDNELNDLIRHWSKLVDEVQILERISFDKKFITKNNLINEVLSNKRKKCTWPWWYMAILSDGNVTLCCYDETGQGSNIIGNVSDASIMDIWSNSSYSKVRDYFTKGHYEKIEMCKACELWSSLYVRKQFQDENYNINHCGGIICYKSREKVG